MIASQVMEQEARKKGMQEKTRRAVREFLLSLLPAFLLYFLAELQASLDLCRTGSIGFMSMPNGREQPTCRSRIASQCRQFCGTRRLYS